MAVGGGGVEKSRVVGGCDCDVTMGLEASL